MLVTMMKEMSVVRKERDDALVEATRLRSEVDELKAKVEEGRVEVSYQSILPPSLHLLVPQATAVLR